MKTVPGLPVSLPPSGQPTRRRFLGWPSTPLGRWSIGLAAIFVVLWIINTAVFIFMPRTVLAPWRQIVLPFYGIIMMLSGFAAGVIGLVSVIRLNERSWLVWLAMLFGLFALVVILGEILVPH